jgi:hypothetical protein
MGSALVASLRARAAAGSRLVLVRRSLPLPRARMAVASPCYMLGGGVLLLSPLSGDRCGAPQASGRGVAFHGGLTKNIVWFREGVRREHLLEPGCTCDAFFSNS